MNTSPHVESDTDESSEDDDMIDQLVDALETFDSQSGCIGQFHANKPVHLYISSNLRNDINDEHSYTSHQFIINSKAWSKKTLQQFATIMSKQVNVCTADQFATSFDPSYYILPKIKSVMHLETDESDVSLKLCKLVFIPSNSKQYKLKNDIINEDDNCIGLFTVSLPIDSCDSKHTNSAARTMFHWQAYITDEVTESTTLNLIENKNQLFLIYHIFNKSSVLTQDDDTCTISNDSSKEITDIFDSQFYKNNFLPNGGKIITCCQHYYSPIQSTQFQQLPIELCKGSDLAFVKCLNRFNIYTRLIPILYHDGTGESSHTAYLRIHRRLITSTGGNINDPFLGGHSDDLNQDDYGIIFTDGLSVLHYSSDDNDQDNDKHDRVEYRLEENMEDAVVWIRSAGYRCANVATVTFDHYDDCNDHSFGMVTDKIYGGIEGIIEPFKQRMWDIIRLIWIGYKKNSNKHNDKKIHSQTPCFFSRIPKDVVKMFISYLVNDDNSIAEVGNGSDQQDKDNDCQK